MSLYATLRSGNLPGLDDLQPEHEQLAAALRQKASEREDAAAKLADALNLPHTATLAEMADLLSPPLAEVIRAARERLRELTKQVEQFQSANANLISHLRSYFRGVLDGLTVTPPPTRYGPTGNVLSGATGVMLQAIG